MLLVGRLNKGDETKLFEAFVSKIEQQQGWREGQRNEGQSQRIYQYNPKTISPRQEGQEGIAVSAVRTKSQVGVHSTRSKPMEFCSQESVTSREITELGLRVSS